MCHRNATILTYFSLAPLISRSFSNTLSSIFPDSRYFVALRMTLTAHGVSNTRSRHWNTWPNVPLPTLECVISTSTMSSLYHHHHHHHTTPNLQRSPSTWFSWKIKWPCWSSKEGFYTQRGWSFQKESMDMENRCLPCDIWALLHSMSMCVCTMSKRYTCFQFLIGGCVVGRCWWGDALGRIYTDPCSWFW